MSRVLTLFSGRNLVLPNLGESIESSNFTKKQHVQTWEAHFGLDQKFAIN